MRLPNRSLIPADVVAAYRGGKTGQEIADSAGVTRERVYQVLRAAKEPLRRTGKRRDAHTERKRLIVYTREDEEKALATAEKQGIGRMEAGHIAVRRGLGLKPVKGK